MHNGTIPSRPSSLSTAHAPDLDWSQVRETVAMLALAVAQIEASMAEGDESISTLSNAFTFIAASLHDWREKQTAALTQSAIDQSQIDALEQNADSVQAQVNNAIIAFQFYDRLTQRLHHVKSSLLDLGDLIGDGSRLYNPEAWQSLQQGIKKSYTMEAERAMFDAILQGASVEEALNTFRASQSAVSESEDDIELF